MPHDFERLTHSLRSDRAMRSSVLIVMGVLLLVGWAAWALETGLPLLKVFR